MKRRWIHITLIALLLSLALLTGIAHAQVIPPSYNLSWWTVDGGGDSGSASGYSLNGTAGQPIAGSMSGSGYQLTGGFWHALTATIDQFWIYLPLIVR